MPCVVAFSLCFMHFSCLAWFMVHEQIRPSRTQWNLVLASCVLHVLQEIQAVLVCSARSCVYFPRSYASVLSLSSAQIQHSDSKKEGQNYTLASTFSKGIDWTSIDSYSLRVVVLQTRYNFGMGILCEAISDVKQIRHCMMSGGLRGSQGQALMKF